jgi:DMSO reductase anchor subunit
MHPAPSIIFFTTASGLGYGLAVLLGLGLLDPAHISTGIAYGVALLLIGGGLLSSTRHLGNPQRAWRALSQWRSSWLSREGVMAIVTFVPLLVSAWLSVVEGRYSPVSGLLQTVFALVTVYCTAMIYASLKSVHAWHTGLTPLCYLLFAIAGGAVLAMFFAACADGSVRALAAIALIALAAAWAVKASWRRHMREAPPLSTPESATGLGFIGSVRLLERPHVTENYLTREMGFRVARKHADKLARYSFVLGAVVPLILSLVVLAGGQGLSAVICALLAVIAFAAGVLTERWLFFAEARHAVMNYYGG